MPANCGSAPSETAKSAQLVTEPSLWSQLNSLHQTWADFAGFIVRRSILGGCGSKYLDLGATTRLRRTVKASQMGHPFRKKNKQSSTSRRKRIRHHLMQQLEPRMMLASDWQNPSRPADVNNDGDVTARDALQVINRLSEFGAEVDLGIRVNRNAAYYDSSGDNRVSALDALVIINQLNNSPASQPADLQVNGEGDAAPAGFTSIMLGQAPMQDGASVDIASNFEFVSERFNEYGLFVVDTPDGLVNGLAPDDVGYPDAVFSNATRGVVYSKFRSNEYVDVHTFPAGSYLAAYVLQPANNQPLQAEHLQATSSSVTDFQIGWELHSTPASIYALGSRGFDDVVIDVSMGMPYVQDRAPVLESVDTQSIDEGELLEIRLSATDPDNAAPELRYSVESNAIGLVVNPISGVISWRPNESDGPGIYEVTATVADPSGNEDSQSFSISVREVNNAPTLVPIADVNIDEGDLLQVAAVASDPDDLASNLRFSVVTDAAGLQINATTGLISWRPAEVDGPGTYAATVTVVDPLGGSDSQTFNIAVAEINQAPDIFPIANRSVVEGDLLEFTVTATDSDVPANQISYEISPDVPGVSINSETGAFSWIPTADQAGMFSFTVTARDNGTPQLSDSESFSVSVSDVDCPFSTLENWNVSQSGGVMNPGTATVNDCVVQLIEGDSFVTTLQTSFTVPADSSTLEFTYSDLAFDMSDDAFVNDAFEASLVDQNGVPLVATFESGRNVFFNATEGLAIQASDAVTVTTQGGATTVALDLSGILAGQEAFLQFRLANNDSDETSSVRITDFNLPGANRAGEPNLLAPQRSSSAAQARNRVVPQTLGTSLFDELATSPVSVSPGTVLDGNTSGPGTDENVFVNFDDFANTSVLSLNGTSETLTTEDGVVLRLASANTFRAGSAFSQTQVNASDFSSAFSFRISDRGGIRDCDGDRGADGFVFVVQSISSSIGSAGGGLGFSGIDNSIGVEFDTFCNANFNDPSSNHIGIDIEGSVVHDANSSDTVTVEPDFDDGNLWYAWVDYDGTTLEVRANQSGSRPTNPLIEKVVDIPNVIEGETAFVGFTAGTGAAVGHHDLISWQYNDSFSPIGVADFVLSASLPKATAVAGTPLLLSGNALSGVVRNGQLASLNAISHVMVNGRPVDVLDSAGNFFSNVVVAPGNNVFVVTAFDETGQARTASLSVNGTSTPESDVNLQRLSDVTGAFTGIYATTSYQNTNKQLFVDLAVQNDGGFESGIPLYVTVDNISDPLVTLASPSGYLADGTAFHAFEGNLGRDRLAPSEVTATSTIVFNNPLEQQFTYDLVILGTLNETPVFDSLPIASATIGREYRYDAEASDADGDPLVYSLLRRPKEMTINAQTGEIRWTPSQDDLGSQGVEILVEDGRGGAAIQEFDLSVTAALLNRPPIVTSLPVTLANVSRHLDGEYQYNVIAIDPDGDERTFELLESPDGMRVDASSGAIRWSPSKNQFGNHSVKLRVSDGRGGIARHDFVVCVHPDARNHPPAIISTPLPRFFSSVGANNSASGNTNPVEIILERNVVSSASRAVSLTLPDTGGEFGTADIIFVIDESRSMAGEHAWLREIIASLNADLNEAGLIDNRFGLVGFADTGRVLFEGGSELMEADDFVRAASSLSTVRSGREDGYAGIDFALDNFDFREGASRSIVLVTDEDRTVVNGDVTFESISNQIRENDIVLSVVANARFLDQDGVEAFGVEANGTAYVSSGGVPVESQGGVFVGTVPVPLGTYDGIQSDYVEFAWGLGGNVWDLNFLRDTDVAADAFSRAFTQALGETIIEASPISVVASSSDVEFVNLSGIQTGIAPGGTASFDVTFVADPAVPFDLIFMNADSGRVLGSIPVSVADLYRYQIIAIDPDDDVLEYSIVSSPNGAEIDATGLLTWRPTEQFAGVAKFVVEVADVFGGLDSQTFEVGLSREANGVISGIKFEDVNQNGIRDADAGVVTLPNASVSSRSETGVDFILSQALLPDSTVLASVTGTVNYNASNNANYSAEWNAAGVVVSSETNRLAVGGTDPQFIEMGWLRLAIGNQELGYFPLFDQSEENGLGSDNPPASLTLDRTAREIFGDDFVGLPAGTALSYIIIDSPRGDNTGEFVVSTSVRSERGLADWAIYLDDNDNGRRDVGERFTLTDSQGAYQFTNLTEGSYVVREETQSGWASSSPANGFYRIALQEGAASTSIDFGNFQVVGDNESPEIADIQNQQIEERDLLLIDVIALDPENDSLTFALPVAPDGVTIHPSLGTLVWRPTESQVGVHDVVVQVSDARGLSSSERFSITVTAKNSLPTIISSPLDSAVAGTSVSRRLRAQDADGDGIVWRLKEGPAGLSVDLVEVSGANGQFVDAYFEINWDVPLDLAGQNVPLRLTAIDDRGGEAQQASLVSILDPASANRSPRFTSTARSTARIGRPWGYQAAATDLDSDSLTYTLAANPAGMSISSRGFLSWTPTADAAQSQSVEIVVTDGRGGEDRQSFDVRLVSVDSNQSPSIQSIPRAAAIESQLYRYDMVASDPENDPLTWELVTGPRGMSVDRRTGTLTWVPDDQQFGNHFVEVAVRDPLLGQSTQRFDVHVGCNNLAPAIVSVPPTRALTDRLYVYAVRADDFENDSVGWRLVDPPEGMTIDPESGVIQWRPSESQIGQHAVNIEAFDEFGVGTQAVEVLVVDSAQFVDPNDPSQGTEGDRAPVITSTPDFNADIDAVYTYQVRAIDLDGDTISYRLGTGSPAGMTVSESGLITWTPATSDAGEPVINVLVSDAQGATTTQAYVLQVRANSQPVIGSDPVTTVTRGAAYRYSVRAQDADGDALSWALSANAPDGMSIDRFGQIRWATVGYDDATAEVTVTVSDGRGGTDSQDVTIALANDVAAPAVSIIVTAGGQRFDGDSVIDINSNYVVWVVATDNVGVVNRSLSIDGVLTTLDQLGTVSLTASQLGTVTLEAFASDAAGLTGTTSSIVKVVDPADRNRPIPSDPNLPPNPGVDPTDNTAPVVFFDSPLPGDTVSGLTSIIGTVDDPEDNLWYYRTFVGRADQVSVTSIDLADPDWTLLNESTAEVINGEIAQFDPSMLNNDVYTVLVAAFDVSGNGFANWTTVNVDGNLTLGNFRLEFTDLSVPLSGIPIEINRVYDTLDAGEESDFGFGWTFGTQDPRILETAPRGTEFIPGSTKVYLTSPEGRRIGFTYEEEIQPLFCYGPGACIYQGFLGDQRFKPFFRPDPGVYARLEATDLGLITRGGLSDSFTAISNALSGGPQVNPDAYSLTTKEGLQYSYGQDTGLEVITDLNGNTVTFTETAITHSSGESIQLNRDLRGRIESIVDPSGEVVNYEFDLAGDLVSVTNQEGLETRYEYLDDPAHYFDQAFDSLNNRSLKVVYDEERRFSHVEDAFGQIVNSQAFDIAAKTGVVRDARGNETVLEFNDRGNVLVETDPLGFKQYYSYEDSQNPDLETRIVDKNGHVTLREFDSRGNLLRNLELGPETAPFAEPIVTTYTYDDGNRVTSVTDARNNTTRFRYDDRGNLVQLTNALSDASSFTYDSEGNVSTFTDFNGNVTRFEDYVGGQPQLITYGDGTQQQLRYNQYGQTTFEAYLEPDGTIAWQRTQEFDRLGRLIEEVLGSEVDGSATTRKLFYDGDVLDWEIIVHPDSLDSNGNLIESPATPVVNRQSSITDYVYDDKLQLIQQIDAEGGVIDFRWDADGNRIALRDPVGNLTTWLYDEQFQPIEERDPLYWDDVRNRDTVFSGLSDDDFLDLVAPVNPDSIADPLYDDPSGASCSTNTAAPHVILTCYDGVGNLDKKIDRNGRRIEYDNNFMQDLTEERWYSVEGDLVRALRYTFDEVGNMLTASDPDSNLIFTYDAVNQQLTADNAGTPNIPRVLLTYEYDANGNVESVFDGSGVTVASAYNERNLLEVRQWLDAISAGGLDVDPLRFEFDYDALGHQTRENRYASFDQSNLVGHVVRGYDQAGRSTAIDFTNTLDQLLSKYEFTYDALGRMASSSRNEIDAAYTHDLTNQLTSTARSNGNNEFFNYDANGNRTSPGYETGTSNRLETDGSYLYGYDGEGNRTTRTSSETNTIERYEYDHRNRLTRITEQEVGREELTVVTFAYDAYNRRIIIETADGFTTTVYDRLHAWVDFNGSGEVVGRNVYGEQVDKILASRNAGQAEIFVNSDNLASVTGYVGRDGELLSTVDYLSFGALSDGSLMSRFGFTGREHGVNSAGIFYRARSLDPATGQFTTSDPIGFESLDSNLYRYALNSPDRFRDPTGETAAYSYGLISLVLTTTITGSFVKYTYFTSDCPYLTGPGNQVLAGVSGATLGLFVGIGLILNQATIVSSGIAGTTVVVGAIVPDAVEKTLCEILGRHTGQI